MAFSQPTLSRRSVLHREPVSARPVPPETLHAHPPHLMRAGPPLDSEAAKSGRPVQAPVLAIASRAIPALTYASRDQRGEVGVGSKVPEAPDREKGNTLAGTPSINSSALTTQLPARQAARHRRDTLSEGAGG